MMPLLVLTLKYDFLNEIDNQCTVVNLIFNIHNLFQSVGNIHKLLIIMFDANGQQGFGDSS